MKGKKSGFTLLEVILVTAIATLLFMSVVVGIGGRIANGRYETATNEIADYIRDAFSDTLNVENTRFGVEGARRYCTLYSSIYEPGNESNKGAIMDTNDQTQAWSNISPYQVYPGRTACAIYGKILFIGATDGKIHNFDIVGNTVTMDRQVDYTSGERNQSDIERLQTMSVLEQLQYVGADFLASVPENSSKESLNDITDNCKVQPASGYSTYIPKWGTLFKNANFGRGNTRSKDDDFVGFIMIVREPATGNVQTLFYQKDDTEPWDFASLLKDNYINSCDQSMPESTYDTTTYAKYSPVKLVQAYQSDQSSKSEDQRDKFQGFCIGSDDFYVAINKSIKKYVEIVGNGQNVSAVQLNGSDMNGEDGGNPCQQ